MKKGWQKKTLGDVLVKTETTDPARSPQTEFDYIDVSSVSNETLAIEETQRLNGKDAPSRARRLVKANDVLFATIRPTLRRIAIVPEELDNQVCSTGYFVLRAKPDVDHRFVFYFLQTEGFMTVMEKLQKGASYPAVTDGDVRSQQIPIPPLPEQQRIVGILDEAFDGLATAKANAEQNLRNARALFESHLQSVFTQRGEGWEGKPLSEICDLQNGYAFKSADYIKSSNTLNIRMSSIRPGGSFDAEHNQRFLPDSYAREYASFILKDGDLIIAMTDMAGDPKILGVPTLISNQNGRNFLMNQRVGKLFGFSNNVRVPYLRYFLTSPSIKYYYKSKGAGGLQINISKGDILSAQIPLPSIKLQDRIVDRLDELSAEIRRLESIYQQKLAALDELKKSLLHQAFSGEL